MKLTFITDGHNYLDRYHFIAEHLQQNNAELLIVGGDNSDSFQFPHHDQNFKPSELSSYWYQTYNRIRSQNTTAYQKIKATIASSNVPFIIHPGNNDLTVMETVFKDEFLQNKTKSFLNIEIYAFGHGHTYENPGILPGLSHIQKLTSSDQEFLIKFLTDPQFAELREQIVTPVQQINGQLYIDVGTLHNLVSDSFLHKKLKDENPDIICLHRPIYDVGDTFPNGVKGGSLAPRVAIENGDIPNAKVVLTGHNHGGHVHKVIKPKKDSLEDLVKNLDEPSTLAVKAQSLSPDENGESGFVSINLGDYGVESMTAYKLTKNPKDGISESTTYLKEDGFAKPHKFKEW